MLCFSPLGQLRSRGRGWAVTGCSSRLTEALQEQAPPAPGSVQSFQTQMGPSLPVMSQWPLSAWHVTVSARTRTERKVWVRSPAGTLCTCSAAFFCGLPEEGPNLAGSQIPSSPGGLQPWLILRWHSPERLGGL